LRIFLLALAVIDDVGAILVIALFYSSEISPVGFGLAALGILMTLGLRMARVSSASAYVAPGLLVWAGAYIGGVHPTLAGVVMGLMTPPKNWHAPDAVSPLEKLEHMLHRWVAYAIMPLFAFANAGVSIGQISFEADALWVFLGVMLGLTIGKPVGILVLSWVSVRSGTAVMPRDIRWSAVGVVGMVGGVGFTMALFIADLAFGNGPLLEIAKLAILCGSAFAGLLALLAGYRFLEPSGAPKF
jgi:NhaA family Na+:H+ antiporter